MLNNKKYIIMFLLFGKKVIFILQAFYLANKVLYCKIESVKYLCVLHKLQTYRSKNNKYILVYDSRQPI